MAKRKKTSGKSPVRVARNVERDTGLWIAPDLERRTKGEGGRRGLVDSTYAYYLQLADVALETPKPNKKAAPPSVEPIFPLTFQSAASAPMAPAEHLPPMSPAAAPPKPPKLALPKPAPPKPPKLALPKPAPSKRPKLSIPKPPKRGR